MSLRRQGWTCLVLLGLLTSAVAAKTSSEEVKKVSIHVFPPEAEIRIFPPGSPSGKGDPVRNGGTFQVRGVLTLPVRLSAAGYRSEEIQLKLLSASAERPGHWRFEYDLEPAGLLSLVKHEFRRHPRRSFGILTGLLALCGLILGRLLRTNLAWKRQAELESRIAKEEAQRAKDRLDEVDPNLEDRQIDGYRISHKLGEGATAVVYQATHCDFEDVVAIKFLRSEFKDAELMARLGQEIAIGKDLNHKNLVRLFGFGTFREAPYLVVEYVAGEPLEERVKRGPVDLLFAISVLAQACEGLEYAHARGIVHRDLKPANIFVTPDGTVKILDFGLAKLLDSEKRLTMTGQALGTPYYMSPEQSKGLATEASDIYSLGVIGFQMLTGQLPFDGDTVVAVVTAHFFSPVPSIRESNPSVPETLESLISSMLAKNPEERPASPLKILKELKEISR